MALTLLPSMTPRRLRSLLYGRSPVDVIAALEAWRSDTRDSGGPVDALLASRSSRAGNRQLGAIWREALDGALQCAHERLIASRIEMTVTVFGDRNYPRMLFRDPESPAVLFSVGDLACLEQPRVGIIGTRHATAHGRECARRFGKMLGSHGVGVVSGLARGIDINAHRGALDVLHTAQDQDHDETGRPIGVVASGLDVVYPPEHLEVWNRVGECGVLMSEAPPGTEPQAFRFPLRNRIIAALCDVLVVVESRTTGGSMITVRAALERGITVMAVPGSTSMRSAEGTNKLIRDGASIAVEPEDVLAVLGLEASRRSPDFDPRPRPSTSDQDLLDAIGSEPMTLDHVVTRTRRDLAHVALALGRLENQGWLMCTGGWFERVGVGDVGDRQGEATRRARG